jgi:2-keto-4-pentenoate hydratase/2-oxohepta-3-ene-1,7-dioic acid hydratase in catechol pathway
MRIVVFDDFRIGTWEEDGIHDLTDLVPGSGDFVAPYRMNEFIAQFQDLLPHIETRRRRAPATPVSAVRLQPPTPRPTNFLAAPINYRAHGTEMQGPMASGGTSAREMGFFVKASGSICGPSDAIELPPNRARRFDHEAEVGFVIGREARGVTRESALEHVFGYTLVVDATMRMTETEREERTLRKSFWTFSPTGPCIVTADEIPDPSVLTVRLWINDELRQEGPLTELILDIPGLIEQASAVLPLQPGDLYATGTPSGIGPIVPGDELLIREDRIGEMRLPVRTRSW